VWLFRRHELPSPTLRAVIGRAPAAHCGAVDTRYFRQDLTSIEAACCAARSELAVQSVRAQVFLHQLLPWRQPEYPLIAKQFMTARVNNGNEAVDEGGTHNERRYRGAELMTTGAEV
jgi:hypothetical protein